MIKRILYLAYYLKEAEPEKFSRFTKYVTKTHGIPTLRLWVDMVFSSLRYNISLLEYFNFHFYKLAPRDRRTYAGTGFMYEYQLKMNPRGSRAVLADKVKFLKEYNSFVHHSYISLREIQADPDKATHVLKNNSGKIVLKRTDGQCGRGIKVLDASRLTPQSLIEELQRSGNDLAEEFVQQHDDLMRLSPSGLNTVRIITQLDKNDHVDILGARLRITVNSSVDNLAAGNIAAPVNVFSGTVEGPAVYSDITKPEVLVHPVTGVPIVGFVVPLWQETMKMVIAAALQNRGNRSIGWDIAITNDGPELIEGNHDWCKLLWQLPVKKGLKPMLSGYVDTFSKR